MRSLVATVLCVALTLGSCPSLCASEDNEWKELIEFIGYFAADKLAPGLAAKHSKKLGKVFGTANVSDIKRAVDIVDKGCNNDFKGVRDELAKEGIERIIEYCYPKSFQGPMTLYMSLVDAWIITVQSGIDRWKGDLWNHPSCGAVGALMMKEAGQMAHRGQLYWHSAACEKSDEMGHLVNKMKAVEDKLFKLWESDGHADGLMGDRFLNPLIWHAGGKPQKDRDYFDFFLRGEFERLKERVLFQYESACIRSKMKAARANILRQAKSAGLLKSSIAQSSPSSTTKPITRKPQKPAEWKGKAVYVDEQYTPKPLNLDTFNSIESEIIKAHLRQTWQERLDILEDFDKKMWPFYTLLREGVKEAESFYYNVSQGKALSVPSKEYKRRKEIEKMGSRGRSGVLAQITPAKHKLNGTKIGTKLPGTSYMPPLHRQKIIAETMANFGLPTDYNSTNRVFKGLCKTDKYYCYQPLIDYMKNLKDFCWRTRGLVDLALSDPKNMYEKLPEAEAYWRKAAMARKRFLAHGPLFKGRLPANLHEMGEPFDLMGSGEHGPVNDLVSNPSSQAYAA